MSRKKKQPISYVKLLDQFFAKKKKVRAVQYPKAIEAIKEFRMRIEDPVNKLHAAGYKPHPKNGHGWIRYVSTQLGPRGSRFHAHIEGEHVIVHFDKNNKRGNYHYATASYVILDIELRRIKSGIKKQQ